MAFIEWSENLSVDVKMFDEEHKKLIGLVNDLHGSMLKGKGKDALGIVLKGLIDYTVTHFDNEEKVMEQYNYPGYKLHLVEHKQLTAKVVELRDKYNKGDVYLSMDVLLFLKDWLTHHILETDKQYGAFYTSKGIVL